MPEYINNTMNDITFNIEDDLITLIPKQSIKTDILYNYVNCLTEKSPFPNLTPVVQEDFILGDENEEFTVLITPVTKHIKVTNRSETEFMLYYNSSRTQGVCVLPQTAVSIDFSDPLVSEDVKKLVVKLLANITNPRDIIIDQYRFTK